MIATVTTLHGLDERAYSTERARLQGLYGPTRHEAGVRFEQALAKLFCESGWTLVQLAKVENKPKSHIGRMLIFGRFLDSPIGDDLTLGLNEGRFRGFWKKTFGEEAVRFREVTRLLAEDANTPKIRLPRGIGTAIARQYADGKWHEVVAVAKGSGYPVEYTEAVLESIRKTSSHRCTAEKRPWKDTYQYRLFPQTRQISSVELIEKLQPLLAILEAEGKKNMATMSPPTVAFHTAKIQTLLNEWAGRPVKSR